MAALVQFPAQKRVRRVDLERLTAESVRLRLLRIKLETEEQNLTDRWKTLALLEQENAIVKLEMLTELANGAILE